MLKNNNQILSTLHKVVAYVLIFDLVQMIFAIFIQSPQYFIGSLIGKVFLIYIHFLCAKNVKYGRFENRLGSIFYTIFMLSLVPIGTILAVMMLYYSIFRWEKYTPLNVSNI